VRRSAATASATGPTGWSRVWDLISGVLKQPARLKAGLEEMIEQERVGLRADQDAHSSSESILYVI
jgi:hypothetical protein